MKTAKIAGSNLAPAAVDMQRQQDYQSSDDLRTLHAAHKIKSDKGRHGRAMAKAKQHLASLKAMVGGKPAKATGKDAGDSELNASY